MTKEEYRNARHHERLSAALKRWIETHPLMCDECGVAIPHGTGQRVRVDMGDYWRGHYPVDEGMFCDRCKDGPYEHFKGDQ